MEIFAYGTWSDYLKIKDSLPEALKLPYDSIAAKKLKELTILTIMENKTSISFEELMSNLKIDNYIEAETLLIDLFGSNLMVGKIDEKKHILTCDRAAARCIPNDSESLQGIIDDLNIIRDKISAHTSKK